MKLHDKRFHKPGTAPGTLPDVSAEHPVTVHILAFGEYGCTERELATIDEAFPCLELDHGVTWIDVVGLSDANLLRTLGERLGLRSLALEDVLNIGQRPKFEDHEEYLFIVVRELQLAAELVSEQISFFVGPNYLLTFQERPGDVFEPVRERLRRGGGRLRKLGSDYLAYALIDAVVDNLFPILEAYGERIEKLEEDLIDEPTREELGEVHQVKKDLLLLRRATWPLREVLAAFERLDSPLVKHETRMYLRDCYDHTIQIMDMVETYRDLASGLMDLYLSSVSNRTNEIMKVLTIMASIFIPLTFLAGVYGMNFRPEAGPMSMPELDWSFGYPAFWILNVAVAAGLLWMFRRRGWL